MDRRVIYIVRSWPRLTQTFIVNEILALERRGWQLVVYSMVRSGEELVQPAVGRVRAPIVFLSGATDGRWSRTRTHATVFVRRPLAYLRALLFAIRHPSLAAGYGEAGMLECFAYAVRIFADMMSAPGTRASSHVHAHFAHDPALVGLLVARLAGRRYTFTGHARDLLQIPPNALRERAAAADAIVTCCDANASYINGVLRDAGGPPVHVIRHGVDLTEFSPRGRRRATAVPILLSVGRLVEKKGYADLLVALATVRRRGQPFRCEIYGDGPLRAELVRLRAALNLEPVVELVGVRDSAAITVALASADAFVLTPRLAEDGDRDGIPNSLVEAMASGLPVVSTSAGGIGELIVDGSNGLLTAPRDVNGIAHAIERVLADVHLRARLGSAARATVERGYDVDRAAAGLEQVFTQHPTSIAEAVV